jgi:formyl-CoA transferase
MEKIMNRPAQPLSGIRVLALEQYISAPYCTMLLADSGAEVIKIERTGEGDHRRKIPPFVEKDGVKKGAGFMAYNRNKKSVALDLHHPEGVEIYKALAAKSDVVVENMRPRSMEKINLGYEDLRALNPRLIYAAISGFGRLPGYQGPLSDKPSFDIVAEAMGGVMHAVGFEDKPPSWTIYGMADLYTGMVTAYGITMALFMRERTGEGQFVDSAMYDNMISLNERMIYLFSTAGQSISRGQLRNLYPRGAFKTKDGYIAINIPDDLTWGRLCRAMGRADLIEDSRCLSGTIRAENSDFLQPIIENWLAGLTRAEAVQAINAVGVPAGPVQTAEDIFADPHVQAREMLMTVHDPEVGDYQFARSPLHLSAAPKLPAEPAPRLGQHTRSILMEWLAYSPAEIDRLVQAEVIQT